ncbi:MAG: hypothetical protein HOI07_09665 [Betaproteobacteria bacterium]|nr:hypothetical protein [Betaproteobacteria bacterium]
MSVVLTMYRLSFSKFAQLSGKSSVDSSKDGCNALQPDSRIAALETKTKMRLLFLDSINYVSQKVSAFGSAKYR